MRLVHKVKRHKKHTCGALPNKSSGVDVHSNTRSISFASTFAISRAFLDDSTARLVIVSPSDNDKGVRESDSEIQTSITTLRKKSRIPKGK